MTGVATVLTAAELTDLRERAERGAGPFVDPRLINRVGRWWRPDLCEWATAVTGVDVRDPLRQRGMPNWALLLLDLAHEAEPDPPEPPKLAARRAQSRPEEAERLRKAQGRWERAVRAWNELKDAIPVEVSVAFNYSRYLTEFNRAGKDHIVVWEDLHAGRLRREAGRALCETKSSANAKHLDCADGQRKEQESGKEVRVPNCGGCLDKALRITGLSVKETILAVDGGQF